ncbi:hypothetical protein STANM309S_02432 [Streptomyces tanashiensis]
MATSESRKTRISPEESSAPRLRATATPLLTPVETTRAPAAAAIAAESSVEQSSTTRTSMFGYVWARAASTHRPIERP